MMMKNGISSDLVVEKVYQNEMRKLFGYIANLNALQYFQ